MNVTLHNEPYREEGIKGQDGRTSPSRQYSSLLAHMEYLVPRLDISGSLIGPFRNRDSGRG
jgi:hypothetical protein